MFRLFLYAGLIWLVWKLLKLVFQSVSTSELRGTRRGRDEVRDRGGEHLKADFKDVQDAEFTEMKDHERASK